MYHGQLQRQTLQRGVVGRASELRRSTYSLKRGSWLPPKRRLDVGHAIVEAEHLLLVVPGGRDLV